MTQTIATTRRPLPPHLPPPPPNEQLLRSESQWLFTPAELLHTPSAKLGLPLERERENRAKGVNFIIQVGIMLKLPQITLATASVYLHRFYMRHVMVDEKAGLKSGHHHYSVAATCLFLATKVEENCRKMKELVVACVRVAQKEPEKIVDEQDSEYWRWKDTILAIEDTLLAAICFDVSLEAPYKTMFDFLTFFGEAGHKPLRNAAWAFVNDSCLTMLCLLFSARTIAASALYAAAKHCGVRFRDDPAGRPWWRVLDVELRCMRQACNYMAAVYENAPARTAHIDGMYQRTPEDGDEEDAKTRERRPHVAGWRRDSTASQGTPASQSERKRPREDAPSTSEKEIDEEADERDSRPSTSSLHESSQPGSDDSSSNNNKINKINNDDHATRNHASDQREPKRLKTEQPIANGSSPSPIRGLASPGAEQGSEDGELEY